MSHRSSLQERSRIRARHVHASGPRQPGLSLPQRGPARSGLRAGHAARGLTLLRRLRRPRQARLHRPPLRRDHAPEDPGRHHQDCPKATKKSGLNTCQGSPPPIHFLVEIRCPASHLKLSCMAASLAPPSFARLRNGPKLFGCR